MTGGGVTVVPTRSEADSVAVRMWSAGGALVMVRLCVAVLVVAVLAGCSGGRAPNAADPSAAASPSPVVTSPYPSPPGGGKVRLVEQGFSVTLDEGRHVRYPRLTYGLVFENTSDVVAAFVQIQIRALDKSGKVLKAGGTLSDNEPDTTVIRNEITYLLPGERVGVSDAGYMWPHESARQVVRLEVKVGKVEWWAPKNGTWCFSAARATKVKLVDQRKDAGSLEFDVAIEQSPYMDSLTGDVIFRDERQRIVGGGHVHDVSAGAVDGSARIGWGIPLKFDPSKIEFYPRVQQPLLSACPAVRMSTG